MKLNKAFECYVAYLEDRQLSSAHCQTVVWRIGRFCDLCGDWELKDIGSEEIGRYFDGLRRDGLAMATCAGHKSTHRAFWSWCVAKGWVDGNPTDVLLSNAHNYTYRPVSSRPAPRDDFQAVMDSLEAFARHRDYHPRDVRDAALISLAADSAKRRKELWNLRRRDVEKALAHGEWVSGGRLVYRAASSGKTGQATVIFFEETAVLLADWLGLMPAGARWLWVNLRTGRRLALDSMALACIRICKFVGVPTFRFQAIRKRSVTDIIAKTGDWKVGQLLAGHKDERTTQLHYNDVEQDRVEAMAALLADQRHGRHDGGEDLVGGFFAGVSGD